MGLQLCGHRFGLNLHYKGKIFLHCFGVNGRADVWMLEFEII